MAGAADVKSLLLEVDASVELLRRNLTRGDQAVGAFENETRQRLDRIDRRFETLGSGLRQLPSSIARARADIATLGTAAARTEQQVRASAAGMRSALLASTSTIAAALTVDKIKDYADGYTRFTNQLKVAGLEGANLGKTQNDLYAIAQRYGVQLESVGSLYGRLSQGSKELGASQSDLLKFTSGVGAALKVQGGDASASAGALMQLTQALGGTFVRAEEFNSINEGARPILQAVANGIDKYKGSVSKLRADVIAGTLTSRDFFQGFLKGSAQLEAQAAKSNLTIGASFVVLNNALGKYIGETDASLSATARVAGGITALANNLDTIAPALTVIGVGFATRFAVAPVTAAVAAVAALRAELLASNVVMLGGRTAAAAKAQFVAASAATEVASIESTIVARRAEQVALAEQIATERALIIERQAAAQAAAVSLTQGGLNGRNAALAAQVKANNDANFATQRLTAARQRLAVVDSELAVAEGSLAGAHARSALAAEASAVATNQATLAARAGAAASRLLAGALTLIGGSVAGGAAVLAVGALVGALLLYRSAAAAAEERSKATAESLQHAAEAGRTLNRDLATLAATGAAAASGIAQAGSAASASTGKMLSFAGAVGEAAQKLRELAVARRHEQVLSFAANSVDAERRANEAQARINSRRTNIGAAAGGSAMGLVGGALSAKDKRDNDTDARLVAYYRSLQGTNYRAAQTAANIPLASRIKESDRVGGRDVDGDLARVTRDLVVARKRGIRSQVDSLEAQKYELTQYKAYRKQGLSPQAAQDAASADATSLRGAAAGAQGDRDAKTSRTARNKAEREAATAARQQAALVRDAAADERAYSSAERQANNDIAAARAELSNSATERAQIEKDRIESERQNRANEIEQQAKQGGLGEGKAAETRKLELQRLNDQRATLETQVVDARERQRVADESLAVAQAGRENEVELLQKQADLTMSLGQRRDLERRILAIQYDEERARLDGVIASRDSSETDKKIAERKRAILDQLQASDRQSVDQRNAGPTEQYRERLRTATSDIHEALDGVEARGLQNLEDGLVGIVTGTESVSHAFKKMANEMIADLARLAIQKAIVAAIGGAGGFWPFKDGGTPSDIPGFASGGTPGGMIRGPGNGKSDSILAILGGGKGAIRVSNREYIINEQATREYLPLIEAINSRSLPRFASGGDLSGRIAPTLRPAKIPNLSGMSSGRRDRMQVDVRAKVEASPLLLATVEETSMRTIGAAAEPIMAGAHSRTMRSLNRPDLPGAPV
jgi:tape measure domain-containing protein